MGWIGVDLDGTLAEYERDKEAQFGLAFIGKPIPLMVERVKKWIARGIEVKIVTARANHGEVAIRVVRAWLKANGLPALEVTSKKDHSMIELWDDLAVTVETNTGLCLTKGR